MTPQIKLEIISGVVTFSLGITRLNDLSVNTVTNCKLSVHKLIHHSINSLIESQIIIYQLKRNILLQSQFFTLDTSILLKRDLNMIPFAF